MLWSAYALGTRRELWFGHGCSGQRTLLERERNYGLGMDALVSVRSWNANGTMVWAWMLWSAYALGTRTELWFGHGCSGQRTLLERERNYGLGMDALVSVCSWNANGIMVWAWMLWSAYALGTRTELWFGHGCSGQRTLLERERNYGLGMDALVSVCSWSTNGIMVWAWMLWSAYALGTRTELWFGHGCSGQRTLLERERNYGLGMDALVSVRSWNANGIMVWAWMLWSAYALGTRTELWFGHGCSGQRTLLERERNSGLGMDALVSVRSWNAKGIMVWAWMLWSAYALGTRTELWFGHGCSGQRTLLERERNYGLGMDALVSVRSWNANGIMVWAWMLWSAYALGTRTELWFGHGCSGQRTLLERERNYGLGMDALVSVRSWNANGIMVWAWMLWSAYALGRRTELWFGHGCSGQRTLLEHERNYGLGMDALVSVRSWNANGIMVWAWVLWSAYALGTRTELWFGHGCSGQRTLLEREGNYGLGMDALVISGQRTLLEHERNYGLGMDALVSVRSWNANGIMVWAWMLWSAYALGTRTELWFGHGCSGQRMLLERERNYGLGMDALVSVRSWNANGIMVWAWMLWSAYALGTRTELWFGNGCSGQRTLLEREGNYGLGMDALVSVRSWNANGIMVWAWMLWSAYALGTQTELWFGHGCSGQRTLLERERNSGLGMDALVSVRSWNAKGIMVWAWMLWSAYALGTRRELWFGHGCSGQRTLLERERNYGLGMDALVSVCSWNANGIMVWEWMLWSAYALGTRTELWFGHGCSGHLWSAYALGTRTGLWFGHGCSGQRTLLEREGNYGLGMDALVSVRSWNANGIMVWAWMLWSAYALGTRTELWFEHGCSGQRTLLEHKRNYGLGMDALVSVHSWNANGIMVWAWMLWSAYALGTRRELWFGHGCSGQRTLLERERNYGLGMDALVSVRSWNTKGIMVWAWMLWSSLVSVRSWNANGIMVWAWMLWSAYALGTRTELWFGHGCSGQRTLLERERNYGLGIDALVSVRSWNANGIMVWAWMLWSAYALGTRTELWFGHGCSGQRTLLERERHGCSGERMLVSAGGVLCSLPCCLFCSQVGLLAPLRGQLHGSVSTQCVDQPCGSMAQAASRLKGLRAETCESGTCTKCCVQQYFWTLWKQKCLNLLRLPAILQA